MDIKSEINSDKSGLKHVSVSVSFTKSEVSIQELGSYKIVALKEGFSPGRPGEPALPWKKFHIAVPWDAASIDITVSDLKASTIDERITVEPCQPNVLLIPGTQIRWVPPNHELYSSATIWPASFVRTTVVRRTGGFAMAEVEICPFRYHLKERRLDLIERLDLTLSYAQTGLVLEKPLSMATLRHEQKFAERVKRKVLNPDDVSHYTQIKDGIKFRDNKTYPKVDYVIITSDPLADAFQRLTKWRTQMGLNAMVVTVEDIKAGTVPETGGTSFFFTTGYYDGGTRDEAEAIRNFIKWASVNWLTDYVLLGGDTEIIPCRQAILNIDCKPYKKPENMADLDNYLDYWDISAPDPTKQLAQSAEASTEKGVNKATNVLDIDNTNFWQCAQDDTSPWINLFLGPHTPINSVKLTWGSTYAKSYAVQTSQDENIWIDIKNTSSGHGGSEEIKFPCVSTSYLRLKITSGNTFSLKSIEVYGPPRRGFGVAYKFRKVSSPIDSITVTRVYINEWFTKSFIIRPPDPNMSIEENLKNQKSYLIIMEGAKAGIVIPYDQERSRTKLGWHYVEDLVNFPGIVSTTPTNFLEICGPSEYHGQPFVFLFDHPSNNYFPTDLYYSDIAVDQYTKSDHHDWDTDNNGIYGERYGGNIDSVNGIADISVGRTPVNTPDETTIFVDKVIRYEKYKDKNDFLLPMDFAISMLLGSGNWGSVDDPSYPLDRSAVVSEDIRKSILAQSNDVGSSDRPRWIFTRRYEDYLHVRAEDKTGDLGEANKASIKNAIEKGQNYVSLISHGGHTGLCFIESDDIKNITNHPGIFFGNACNTAMFDVANDDAIAEWAILNPRGGAVAYLGAGRMGSTGDGPLSVAFWQAFNSDRLGEMFDHSKINADDRQRYNYNLLGDPAMRVWSDRPKQLNVVHAKKICTGQQKFVMLITTNGQPIKDVVVCITMEGTLFATCITDASGKASCQITPSVEGTMKVTVSGKNLIPYIATVTVSTAQPEIQVYDWPQQDVRTEYDQLWNAGMRLHSLNAYVVNNDLRYVAVWHPGSESEIQVYDWSYADMRAEYDKLWNQGMRLHTLNTYVLNNEPRYIAVWKPGNESEIQVYGWTQKDLRAKYDELWGQGWRLHILNAFVVNGIVLYNAVWRPGSGAEIQVFDWPYADMRAEYDKLWNQGMRLHTLNTYVLNNEPRYIAVWKPGNESEIQAYGWTQKDLRAKYDELWGQCWRLHILNAFVVNGIVLYNAVWRPGLPT